MWKKISSKVLLDHPRLTVVEDEVRLPDGSTTKYIHTPGKGSAATIICKRNGKILLQREYSYPPNKLIYQFPGGFVPKDEDVKKGANRELMEEAGLRAGKLRLLGKYLVNNRRSNSYMYVFLATNLKEKKLDGDVEEDIESFWLAESKIDQMVKEGEIINSYALASWALYKSLKLEGEV